MAEPKRIRSRLRRLQTANHPIMGLPATETPGKSREHRREAVRNVRPPVAIGCRRAEASQAEAAAASGTETPKENKVTKIASGFLGVVVLIALAAGDIFYAFTKQKQKKQAEKEALDPDANYTEDKGDFEIPTDVPDEDEAPDEQDTEPI